MVGLDIDIEHFTNVFDLLETLSQLSLDRLYGQGSQGLHTAHPWTCRAVFQSLPALAKQYVMRMLALDEPLPKSTIQDWVDPRFLPVHQRAIAKLDSLRMFVEKDGQQVSLPSQKQFVLFHLGSVWYAMCSTFDRGIQPSISFPPQCM